MNELHHRNWDAALPTEAGLYRFEGVARFVSQSLHLHPTSPLVVAGTEDGKLFTTLFGYIYPITILDGKWQGPMLSDEVSV